MKQKAAQKSFIKEIVKSTTSNNSLALIENRFRITNVPGTNTLNRYQCLKL